jgi:hypothetical protein
MRFQPTRAHSIGPPAGVRIRIALYLSHFQVQISNVCSMTACCFYMTPNIFCWAKDGDLTRMSLSNHWFIRLLTPWKDESNRRLTAKAQFVSASYCHYRSCTLALIWLRTHLDRSIIGVVGFILHPATQLWLWPNRTFWIMLDHHVPTSTSMTWNKCVYNKTIVSRD